jgi:hypothetical protein
MRAARALLGTAGVVMVLVGAYHLYDISTRGASRVVSIAVWTVGGVAVHDAVIAPLVVLVGVLLVPRLPSWARAPVTAGLIVLLSVTLLAIPVIGRFGERPDVPSLLDRPYGLLWLVFALVVTLAVAVACLLRRRTTHQAGGS